MARSTPNAQDRIQAGFDVLRTTVSEATKKVLAQIGSVVGRTVDSENAEWVQHDGFISRPVRPQAGKQASQAVVIRQGDRDIVIASQDLRGIELAGQIGDGETALYAAGPDGTAQGRIILKGDGSINLLTKRGNTAGGAGVGVFVAADGSITALGADGAGIQVGSDGAVRVFNASGALQVGADGGVKLASKAKVDISAPAISLGGLTGQPIALSSAVVTALSSVQTQLAAIAASVTALVSDPTHTSPSTGTAATAMAAAVKDGTTTVTQALLEVPSKRVASD